MKSSVIFTLAWRNLWRNYRRTLIMLMAIVIGVWAMIFMTAMMRGMVDDMIESGIRNLPGHVQIHHPLFRDDPNIVNSIVEPGKSLQQQLENPVVKSWASRLKVPGIISSERDVRGVSILGVNPLAEARIAFATSQISEGRWLENENDKGIVIGAKLAEKLETRLGKRIVLMSQDINNEIGERGFRIVGIYRSNDVGFLEERNVYVGLARVQTMLQAENMVSEVVLNGEDYRNTQPLLTLLATTEFSQQSVEILPWNLADSYLGTMMSVMDGFVIVWVVIIFLALSFGLVNTLVMAVFERVREIGLMQALGMKPTMILVQIVCEALFLLMLGLIAGNLLALATILPFQSGIDISSVAEGMEMFGANSVLYPALKLKDVVLANVIVIVLGIAASILPAWRAASLDPIVALYKN